MNDSRVKCESYKDIVRVTAYDDSSLTFVAPFAVFSQFINESMFSITGSGINLLGSNGTAELSSSTVVSRGGRKIRNELKCSDVSLSDEDIQSLQRKNHHLLCECLSGSLILVRSVQEGWNFSSEDKNGIKDLSITIENIGGAQKVV